MRVFRVEVDLVDDQRPVLLAMYDRSNTNILQKVGVMPAIQSGYTEASWTVLALRSTANIMGITSTL